MLRSSLAILVVFGIGNACCQQPAQSSTSPPCSFTEVYKKDGWTVPGLNGAEAKKTRTKLSNLPGVFVTMLQPTKSETYFQHLWCPSDHIGRIEIEDAPIKVLDLWSYDVDGRLFAYRVSYAREAVNNGVRSELAADSTVFFYDVDGAGRFSVLRSASLGPGAYAPAFIPDWARGAKDPAHAQ